jgi:xanthine dehydrogenase small subunit
MHNTIRFILDDKIVEINFSEFPELKPTTTVLNFLRSYPTHKGVKEGCAEGDCGACTIVIAGVNGDGKLTYTSLDSCLVFLPMIHGKQIITVENLAKKSKGENELHPVQQMMVDTGGSQCGYCTPGIVMSLFGLYKNHNEPNREIVEDSLTGNLCRCTGYQPIIEAALKSCTNQGKDHFSDNENRIVKLLNEIKSNTESIKIITDKQKYFKPFSLSDALKLRKEYPSAIIVNGSTDVALRQTKKKELLTEILDISGVDELKKFNEDEINFVFGSGVSLEQVKLLSEEKFPALHNILKVFGSLQIRNIATIGGNVGSASPIGDTLPLLFACGASIKLSSENTERIIRIEDFIRGYRQTDLRNDELISEIIISKNDVDTKIFSYKVSKRKDLDISTVCGAFRLNIKHGKVSEIVIAFGGMAATTKRALNTEIFLKGKEWTRENVEAAMDILTNEFSPISDARSEAEFRLTAAKNLLLKFYSETKSGY